MKKPFFLYVQRFFPIFNNSENYRTVLTHVERGTYSYIFFYILTAYPASIVKRYFGPQPSIICWWLKWIYNFVPIGLLLSFCVAIIIRVSPKAKSFLDSIIHSNPLNCTTFSPATNCEHSLQSKNQYIILF